MFTKFSVNQEYAEIFVWILGIGLFGGVAEKYSIKGGIK
jgi:hypothetical protein